MVGISRYRIFRAVPSRTWPGDANVHVCLIHIGRGAVPRPLLIVREHLDSGDVLDHAVEPVTAAISSYLDGAAEAEFHDLPSMAEGLVYNGVFLRGAFDRELAFLKEVPTSQRGALGAYLNNEDIQQSARPLARRVVVDFYPALERANLVNATAKAQLQYLNAKFAFVVEALADVKKFRKALPDAKDNIPHKERWFMHGRSRVELREAWRNATQVVLFGAQGKIFAPVVVPRVDPVLQIPICPSHLLYVMPFDSLAFVAVISSPVFEAQLRRVCSTLKSDLRVTPTEIFPGFPLPWQSEWSTSRGRPFPAPVPAVFERQLAPAVEKVLNLRVALLTEPGANGLLEKSCPGGPTDLYNLFDRRDIELPAIQALRAAHRDLLDAVLGAYGWDLKPTWVFDRPWIDGTLRYVPDAATRAAFIERLAALNATRYTEELRLCAEYLTAAVPKTGVKANKLKGLLLSADVRLSDEEREAAFTEAVRLGLLRVKGTEIYRA